MSKSIIITSLCLKTYMSHFYPKHSDALIALPGVYNKFVQKGYYGGRCEVFCKYGEN